MRLVGVRHSAAYDATGQVAPTNMLQRGKSDGRWQKRGHSSEVPEDVQQTGWSRRPRAHCCTSQGFQSQPRAQLSKQQLEECLDVTAERAVTDTPPSDGPTGPWFFSQFNCLKMEQNRQCPSLFAYSMSKLISSSNLSLSFPS